MSGLGTHHLKQTLVAQKEYKLTGTKEGEYTLSRLSTHYLGSGQVQISHKKYMLTWGVVWFIVYRAGFKSTASITIHEIDSSHVKGASFTCLLVIS